MRKLLAPLALVALPLAIGALTLTPAPSVAAGETAAATTGPEMFLGFKCNTCHSIDSQHIASKATSEKMKGPDLSDVGNKHDAAWILGWLKHEQELNGHKHKAPIKGTDDELKKLAAWLITLKKA